MQCINNVTHSLGRELSILLLLLLMLTLDKYQISPLNFAEVFTEFNLQSAV
jgi:hypothetical protein